jgi:sulfide dehydrogenase [flavocytochrome c] flavoprotein chain
MTILTRRSFGALIGASAATLAAPSLLRANTTGRLVIIGGGFGGASAARFARITYPEVEVTLIEPYPTFITCPYGNLILGGKRELPQITHSYDGCAHAALPCCKTAPQILIRWQNRCAWPVGQILAMAS